MPTENLNYYTIVNLVTGLTEGLSLSTYAPYVLSDTSDGTNDGQTAIGDEVSVVDGNKYFFSGGGYEVLATTANGVVVDRQGAPVLLSSQAYSFGDPLVGLNTTDPYTYCFLGGTMIATPKGAVPIEYLKIGDLVATDDGRAVPVKWVGEQRVKKSMFTPWSLMPVCIAKGALGGGLPHTDLYVSADHGLIIDGLVINAGAIVNGSTIRYVPMAEMPPEFIYYHIETEAHDAILANGAAAETFIDYAARKDFDNYAEYEALYGAERIIPEMPRPRISTRRLVPEAIKDRLDTGPDWETALEDPTTRVTLDRGAA